MAEHPVVFERDHIGDEKLKARLAAIGDYDIDVESGVTEITWDPPRIWKVDWAPIFLTVRYPRTRNKLLRKALKTVDTMTRQFPALSEHWTEQVVEHFRWFCEKRLEELGEAENYELGGDGKVTERSILSRVSSAGVTFDVDDESDVEVSIFFSVDWEEEHGIEIEWFEESEDV